MTFTYQPTYLRQARLSLRQKIMDLDINRDITCPCCEHVDRVQKWSLYSTAIMALVYFYKLGASTKPIPSSELPKAGHTGKGDVSRLLDYELIVRSSSKRGEKKGRYMITDLGMQFLEGRARIPKYIWLFGTHRIIQRSEEKVYIKDLIEGFDLDQVLLDLPQP